MLSRVSVSNCSSKITYPDHCLICLRKCALKQGPLTNVDVQASLVYLVQNLLSIPEEHVVSYLQNYGNPTEWFNLCVECQQILDNAIKIQRKVASLQKQLETFKETFKVSIALVKQEDGGEILDGIGTIPTNLIREFVKDNYKTPEVEEVEETKPCKSPAPSSFGEIDGNENELSGSDYEASNSFVIEPTNSSSDNEGDDEDYQSKPRRRNLRKRSRVTIMSRSRNRKVKEKKIKQGFKCTIPDCTNTLGDLDGLENHIRATHNPPQLRECLGCNQTFRYFQNYLKHLAKENCEKECTSKAIQCPLCKNRKYFANSEDALDIHNKINHTERPPNPYKCFKCDATFCRRGHLKQHELLLHKEGVTISKAFQCSICSRAFISDKDLISHENSHKNSGDNYEECNKIKATVVGVVVENSGSKSDRQHYRRLQYNCDSCDAVFFQTRSLKKHALIEHQIELNVVRKALPRKKTKSQKGKYLGPPAKCDECQKIYCSQSSLMAHKRLLHPNPNSEPMQTLCCEICGDTRPKNKFKLQQHMKQVHTSKLPGAVTFPCLDCNIEFRNKYTLKDHITFKHQETRTYCCEQCGKSFKTSGTLAQHVTIMHDAEKRRRYMERRKKYTRRKKKSVYNKLENSTDADCNSNSL